MAAARGGRPLPAARAAGRDLPGLVIDVDATLVATHSEKEGTAGNYKGGYGYHPLLAFLDNTGEALAGVLRPGNAGSNTAADHVQMIDLALAQIPDAHLHGTGILVRADGAGCSKAWLAHLRRLRPTGAWRWSLRFPSGGGHLLSRRRACWEDWFTCQSTVGGSPPSTRSRPRTG